MKKYVYGALVILCCPFVLNVQQAYATEVSVSNEEISAVGASLESSTQEVVKPTEESSSSTEETTLETSEVPVEDLSSDVNNTEGATESTIPTETEEIVDSNESVSTESSELPVESDEDLTAFEETEVPVDSVENLINPMSIEIGSKPLLQIVLNVQYVLADGSLVATGTYTGNVGETGYVDVPAGYVVSGISDPSFYSSHDAATGLSRIYGTLSENVTMLTVTVVADTESGVLFNFVDEAGNPVIGQSSVLKPGVPGEAYSFTAPAVKGYTTPAQTEYTGTLGAGVTVINIVYTRVQTSVTLVYVDEAGNSLGTNEVWTAGFGDVYSVWPAVFYGMELVSVNGQPLTEALLPITLTFEEVDQTLVFVYREASSVIPTEIVPPKSTPGASFDGEAPQITKQIVAPLEQPLSKQVLLPETGEKETSLVAMFAGTIMAAQAVYLFKRKQENELEG